MRTVRTIICLFLFGLSLVYGQGASSGTIRLLIARPNNFDYTTDPKTMWVSAVTEAFLYFRLDAIDRLKIVPLEDVTPLVSSHRDFSKRISKSKYLNAGKELNATYVLYSEYSVQSNKLIEIYFTVDLPDKSKKAQKTQATVSLGNMNTALTDAVREIASLIGVSKSELPEDFFSINVLGKDAKNAKRLGNYLMTEKKGDRANQASIASNCEKITNSDYSMYLAYYIGSKLYAKAGNEEGALRLIQALVDKLEDRYPKLNLQLATFYRKNGKLHEAKSAIDRLGSNPNLRHAVLWEKGLVYEAMGNMTVALSSFKKLEAIDKDPLVYLHLAKVSLSLKKTSEAHEYVKNAARLSGKSEGKIYCDIGDEFAQANDKNNAMAAYKRSIKLKPDNTDAWLALGNIQRKSGLDSAAAVSYINLFKLDYIKYGDYLEKAGKLLEKRGLMDMARQVYTVSFEKHGDPKIAVLLARLEFRRANYKRTRELLVDLGPPWSRDPEVVKMLEKCTEDKTPPKLTLKGTNPMTIKAGSGDYIEPGANAMDDVDGDLSMHIEITGKVRTTVLGTYTITYVVSDGSKNETKVIRKVIVTDDEPPVIELTGQPEIHLMVGDKYREPGVRAHDTREGNLTSRIAILGTVNTYAPGTYKLTYTVKDAAGNSAVPKTRLVIVAGDSDAPRITLIGGTPMHLTVGDRYREPGAMANDNVDGNLTSKITVSGTVNTNIVGTYKIAYSVKDNAGNLAAAERVVNVREPAAPIDNRKPVIKLIGGSPNTISVGETYEEPGVNATDNIDGDLTAFINIEGEVDPSRPGTYSITYTVSDKSGNKTEKVLRVRVKPKVEPRRVARVDDQTYQPQRSRTPDLMPKPARQRTGGRSKRKPVLAVLTGLGGTGGFLLGLIYNNQASKHLTAWHDINDQLNDGNLDPDEREKLEEERDGKEQAANQAVLLRNLSYVGAGVFGLGFTINLAIPSRK